MKPAKTQTDQGLGFDGAAGTGVNRGSNKYAHNQWSGHSNDGRLVNYPHQMRTGNNGECHNPGTPSKSVTKDAARRAPDRVGSGARPSNPDAINVGSQQRNPGGTRSWEPKAGQNYSGNPDKIRAGQSGGNSYGSVSRGSRPVAPGSTGGINYGPKSQY